LENISLASFDTTMSLPVTFSTFKNRHFDEDTASCHSFDVDCSLRRHRNRHHPRFHQELKRDRDIISARSRARFEAQERKQLISHQSDSQLYRDTRSLTLPSRLSPDRHAGRDFYRDLDLARKPERERSHQSDSQLDYEQKIMTLPRERRTKRDFYRDLEPARMPEREPLVSHQSDSQLDYNLTLPGASRERRAKPRNFYRDLELASKRDTNHNDIRQTKPYSSHGPDSDYEREFERVLERSDHNRPKHRPVIKTTDHNPDHDDSDQFSIGDQLDRIADEDRPKRAATLPRSHKMLVNGYPPQMEPLLIKVKPVQDHEKHLVIVAQAVPDGEVINDKTNKKDKNSNKKDVKLRNHSSRRKENIWKPRLSIVSEV
jgi:hypothetical protein